MEERREDAMRAIVKINGRRNEQEQARRKQETEGNRDEEKLPVSARQGHCQTWADLGF